MVYNLKLGKQMLVSYVVLFSIMALFFANSLDDESQGIGKLKTVFQQLCVQLKGLLPVVIVLMLFAAAVVYVAGQIMGAETRSRANVWATAMLTGGIIAVIIVVIMPPIIGTMLDVDASEMC